MEWRKGGVINNAEIARKFAEVVLEHTQSKEELERQVPLTVEDRGDNWFIPGSWNRDKSVEGGGAFEMPVRKRDAQVLDVGIPIVMKLSPGTEQTLRAAMRTREDQKKLEAILRGIGHLPSKS